MSESEGARRRGIGLRHLSYFLAVIEEGSFVRAAETLYVAASGVSQTIAELEQHLDAVLFERSRSGSRPTYAGLSLVEPARRAVRSFDDALNAQTDVTWAAPLLSVLSTPSLIQEPTSSLIGALHRRMPDVRVALTEPTGLSVADALQPVLAEQVDVAVTEHPDNPPQGTRVVRMPAMDTWVVAPPGTPLPRDGSFTVGDLIEIGLVVAPLFESSDVYRRLQSVEPRIDRAVMVRTEHRDAFMRLAVAGAGAVLLERGRAQRAAQLGCVIGPLLGLAPRRISAVALQRRSSPPLEEFLRLCAEPRDAAASES